MHFTKLPFFIPVPVDKTILPSQYKLGYMILSYLFSQCSRFSCQYNTINDYTFMYDKLTGKQ